MWQEIRGHDEIAERFRRTLLRGRLASTYLFVGPSGIGKRAFALQLAKSLLCLHSADRNLSPCGKCQSCALFDAGNHPDLLQVKKPVEKSSMPIELFIGKRENRNQEGLCHDISMRPMVSRRRVAIVDDADTFNDASANCLLKTLEEPPPRSLIVLLGTSLAKQLPTIRSRSQVVRFTPLSEVEVAQILQEQSLVADAAQARKLARRGSGSVEAALAAQDDDLWQFREAFLGQLATTRLNDVQLARFTEEFVKLAGKEAPPRRLRLRQVIGFAVELYRGLLMSQVEQDVPEEGDSVLRQSLERLSAQNVPTEQAYDALQTCLAAEEYVLRNANQSTMIQWWMAELASNLGSVRRNVRFSQV